MIRKDIEPLHDRVIIKPVPIDSKTPSGIIIPDSAKERPVKGEVLFVGDGLPNMPMTVKVGDMVLYGKNAGSDIELKDGWYLIMRETDIIAIV